MTAAGIDIALKHYSLAVEVVLLWQHCAEQLAHNELDVMVTLLSAPDLASLNLTVVCLCELLSLLYHQANFSAPKNDGFLGTSSERKKRDTGGFRVCRS